MLALGPPVWGTELAAAGASGSRDDDLTVALVDIESTPHELGIGGGLKVRTPCFRRCPEDGKVGAFTDDGGPQ